MKLCVIYNFAPEYRRGIFSLMERSYDCLWCFGTTDTDIKELDLTIFSDVKHLKNKIVVRKPLYWQHGALSLLFRKRIDNYLILGDLFCLSTWCFLLLRKLCFFRSAKRIYLWSHGWYGKESYLRRVLKKIFFGLSDAVFVYGFYAKSLMLKDGFSARRLHVIHNSLDYVRQKALRLSLVPSDFYNRHFANEFRTLIFVGRLTEVKKLDLLLKAVSILKQRGIFYNLVFVGDGEMRTKLEIIAQEENLTNVWFYGSCYDEAKTAELIYNADLCVSPGNVGLTAIHSMMFGTPVVTHNNFSYQMPEFESVKVGVTGLFFDYGNPVSLAESIVSWFSLYAEDREQVRKHCYQEVDVYWTPQFQLNVLQEVLK